MGLKGDIAVSTRVYPKWISNLMPDWEAFPKNCVTAYNPIAGE